MINTTIDCSPKKFVLLFPILLNQRFKCWNENRESFVSFNFAVWVHSLGSHEAMKISDKVTIVPSCTVVSCQCLKLVSAATNCPKNKCCRLKVKVFLKLHCRHNSNSVYTLQQCVQCCHHLMSCLSTPQLHIFLSTFFTFVSWVTGSKKPGGENWQRFQKKGYKYILFKVFIWRTKTKLGY